MTPTALRAGAILYLRPEDVAQDVDEGYYARVTALQGPEVLVERVDGGPSTASEPVATSIATVRQVPDEEPMGSRVSTLLRQGVACVLEDDVRFGQVTATSDLGIQVNSTLGLRWIPRADIVCTVSPLYALLMFDLAVPMDTWDKAYIIESNARMDKLVAEAVECPSLDEVMDAIAGLADHTPGGARREWREIKTGRNRATSTEHALMYTFFVGGGRTVPSHWKLWSAARLRPIQYVSLKRGKQQVCVLE